jgi:hypothetical protein
VGQGICDSNEYGVSPSRSAVGGEPTHAAEAKTQRRVKGEPWKKIIGHLVKMHVVILPESIQLTLLNFN